MAGSGCPVSVVTRGPRRAASERGHSAPATSVPHRSPSGTSLPERGVAPEEPEEGRVPGGTEDESNLRSLCHNHGRMTQLISATIDCRGNTTSETFLKQARRKKNSSEGARPPK